MPDELCELYGYGCKHAIKVLGGKLPMAGEKGRRGGPRRRYGEPARAGLKEICLAAEQPCGQRLQAALARWLPYYEVERGGRGMMRGEIGAVAANAGEVRLGFGIAQGEWLLFAQREARRHLRMDQVAPRGRAVAVVPVQHPAGVTSHQITGGVNSPAPVNPCAVASWSEREILPRAQAPSFFFVFFSLPSITTF